jgi:hypothetical protein
MKTIITPEQVEFRNSFFSIIYPKQSDLEFLIGIQVPWLWFRNIMEGADAIKYLEKSFGSVIFARVKSKNKIIKFHLGLLGRIYYYLRLDFLFDTDVLLKEYTWHPQIGFFNINAARTLQFGNKGVRKFLLELKVNGYDVDKDLLFFEKLAEINNKLPLSLYSENKKQID